MRDAEPGSTREAREPMQRGQEGQEETKTEQEDPNPEPVIRHPRL